MRASLASEKPELAMQWHPTKNGLTGVIDRHNQITVNVVGHNVTVRGYVNSSGVFKIGTAFIKP